MTCSYTVPGPGYVNGLFVPCATLRAEDMNDFANDLLRQIQAAGSAAGSASSIVAGTDLAAGITTAGGVTNSLATWMSLLAGTSNPNPVVIGGAASLNGGGNLTGTFTGSPVFPGNPTFSGTVNLTGALSPASIATSGAANLTGGGALAGTFTGSPTFSGSPAFSGSPTISPAVVTSTGSNTARSLATRFAAPGNVKDFGAIGDGSSHPASTVYGSLGALQAVYGTTISGVTVALTQEMDWLGTQLAINTAAASGSGRGEVVYSPGAKYVYSNANSVSDGSGTLSFPGTGVYSSDGAVSWQGDFLATIHTWPTDLGAGRFAVLCANRASGSSVGFFEGHKFIGPGNGSTYGTSGCNMQGIATNDGRAMRRLFVSAFRVGINVVGGQFLWEDVRTGADGRNYYGVYFDNPNSSNWGNMEFVRVALDNNNKAAIGVHHNASIISSHFLSCFLGTGPYGIFKETNSGSPGVANVISECIFDNCQFENLGNGMICDDTAAPVNRVATIFNCLFSFPQFSWGTSYKIAAVSAYAVIDVGTIVGTVIDGIASAFSWLPGTSAMISSPTFCGLDIRGDINTLFANCVAAVAPQANQLLSVNDQQVTFRNTQGYGYEWAGILAFAGVAVAVGQILLVNTALSGGTSTETPIGIVMYAPTSGNWVPVANSGYVPVSTTGVITAFLALRTAAAGVGQTTGTNAIVGVAAYISATNLWGTYLRGMV